MPLSLLSRPLTGTHCLVRAARLCSFLGMTILPLSCGRDGISSPSGTALSGTVALKDAWGNDLADSSGVTVSIDGLSLKAVTDKNGSWHIDDVPAGRYNIILTKATFG